MVLYATTEILNSKLTNIEVSFKEDTVLHLQNEQKQFTHPNKFVKPVSEEEALKRNKRCSTLLQNKNPGTPMDPLQIIHPVTKAEYRMLFEHQGYLMQGLRQLYLFIAIKLPHVTDVVPDPDLMPECHRWPEQWDPPSLQPGTFYNEQPYDKLIHQYVCEDLSDTY